MHLHVGWLLSWLKQSLEITLIRLCCAVHAHFLAFAVITSLPATMNGCVEQQWKPARMHTLTPKELGLPKQAARHTAWAQARAQGASTFKDFPARALHSHPNTQRTGNSKQCGRAHGHRTSIDGGRSHRDSTGSGVSSSRRAGVQRVECLFRRLTRSSSGACMRRITPSTSSMPARSSIL